MDARLPEAARRRYRRQVRHGSDVFGLLLVVSVWVGGAAWLAQVTSVWVDMAAVAGLPPALGFTMWSGHPAHRQLGAPAPLVTPPGAVAPLRCTPDNLRFVMGLAVLKDRLGRAMGTPLECEHAVDATGDTLQRTTSGTASFFQGTQTAGFSDGLRHWTLADGELRVWMGAGPGGPAIP